MRTLYELAWQSALPIEEYVKATKTITKRGALPRFHVDIL